MIDRVFKVHDRASRCAPGIAREEVALDFVDARHELDSRMKKRLVRNEMGM